MIARLIQSRRITARDTLYEFDCPELARKAAPGQFVELALGEGEGEGSFLRRPISIFDCDGERRFFLLVRTVGRGTQAMTGWKPGREVDVLGPLGNGFSWPESAGVCVLVGGGIGLAPLTYLARRLLETGWTVRLLFSPRREDELLDALPQREKLEIRCAENRTQLPVILEEMLAQADCVFACGPEGMLETVAVKTMQRDIPCQLSMERHMACGIGICLGCAIAVRTPEGLTYQKVCKDGPVFRAEEVSFHEQP